MMRFDKDMRNPSIHETKGESALALYSGGTLFGISCCVKIDPGLPFGLI